MHMTFFTRRGIIALPFLAMFWIACSTDPSAQQAKSVARGKKYLEHKDYARAILEFRNATKPKPNDAEPWYQLCVASLAGKQTEQAILAFRHATKLNPNYTAAQLRLSQAIAITEGAPNPSIAESNDVRTAFARQIRLPCFRRGRAPFRLKNGLPTSLSMAKWKGTGVSGLNPSSRSRPRSFSPNPTFMAWLFPSGRHNRLICAHYQGGGSLRASARILARRLESRASEVRAAPSGRARRNISRTC
jgi:tetratricopeptide (TPR) repeat protein